MQFEFLALWSYPSMTTAKIFLTEIEIQATVILMYNTNI